MKTVTDGAVSHETDRSETAGLDIPGQCHDRRRFCSACSVSLHSAVGRESNPSSGPRQSRRSLAADSFPIRMLLR